MRTMPISLLALPALLGLLACDPRTTEKPGLDPRLEAEVDRLATAFEASPLGPKVPPLVVALVDEGELQWVRPFGQDSLEGAGEGKKLAADQVFKVPQLLPMVVAVGLERLIDQGQLTLTGERRSELLAKADPALWTAELEKAAGQSWRTYLQQEIFNPLEMKSTQLPEGAPTLESSASDLVRLMVDLQKANAGRTWRRLRQEGAKRLLRPLDEKGEGLGLEFGGQGQAAYFSREGAEGDHAFIWLGFVSSGNGAVIFGPKAEVVDQALSVVAATYDWPALKK